MKMKKTRKAFLLPFTAILLSTLILTSCGSSTSSTPTINADKTDFVADDSFGIYEEEATEIYLDDYIYPYYYHLVSTNDELPTPNAVQDKDEHGKFYPYSYSLCTEEQKPFYQRLITAIYNMEPSFDCSGYNMTADDVNTIFKRVLMEMPEFYYLGSSFKYELDDNR